MRKTTEQWRAKAAWGQVEDVKGDMDTFSTVADGASSLVQKVGFGQAVAFWLAKGGKNKELLDLLAQWLLKPKQSNEPDPTKTGKDLMKHITEIDSSHYRVLTNEALAYLFWLKRFSKAKKMG